VLDFVEREGVAATFVARLERLKDEGDVIPELVVLEDRADEPAAALVDDGESKGPGVLSAARELVDVVAGLSAEQRAGLRRLGSSDAGSAADSAMCSGSRPLTAPP
jgi:hypothetical protein